MTNPQQIALHGVLMSIYGIGTFIRGQSGIGKSEVALSLIDRNHLLIADDMAVLTKKEHEIIGSANKDFKNFMHVRGIGIINVIKIFGPSAVIDSSPLHLIVNLTKENSNEVHLSDSQNNFEILNIQIPEVNIPLFSSLNLTIVIETVVKNFLLKKTTGYDASHDFEKIQHKHIGNHHP